MLFAPNLAWRDEPLKQRLESIAGIPVIIENDANAAAWGEFRSGPAGEADDMVLVTVGTGIGGGVVVDGRLLRGRLRRRGELGHMRVVPGRHPVRLRQPRLLGAVRQRQRARPRGARAGRVRHPAGRAAGRACAGGDPAALKGADVTRAAMRG